MKHSKKSPCCARIAVARPVKGTFHYRIPPEQAGAARVGCRALVPFRNRTVTGYILERVTAPEDRDLKDVLEIIDPEPLFNDRLVPFLEWMAEYYIYPIGQVIQSALPAGLNLSLIHI